MKTKSPTERFKIELSNYQVFVILSFFVDLLFVFTIFAASSEGKLSTLASKNKIGPDALSTFKSWKSLFVIGIIVRVLLFCCGGGAAYNAGYIGNNAF